MSDTLLWEIVIGSRVYDMGTLIIVSLRCMTCMGTLSVCEWERESEREREREREREN